MNNIAQHAVLVLFVLLRLTCVLKPFAIIDQKYREVSTSDSDDFYSKTLAEWMHASLSATMVLSMVAAHLNHNSVMVTAYMITCPIDYGLTLFYHVSCCQKYMDKELYDGLNYEKIDQLRNEFRSLIIMLIVYLVLTTLEVIFLVFYKKLLHIKFSIRAKRHLVDKDLTKKIIKFN